jgi:alpha-L-rhamnosidase
MMKKLYLLILAAALYGCSKNQEEAPNHEFGEDDNTKWITDGRPLPASDSLFYLNHPAPLFRKEFKTDSSIKEAKLYITAAGYYSAFINGARVGKNVLDPAWTDFSKRIYYTEYDVSATVQKGLNCLGVSLGNGFYNPLPLRKWGHRNLRNDLPVGKPTFIAKLIITYNNGQSKEITSDDSWKYDYGPIIKNDVYLGVVYDAREEQEGWNDTGFSDRAWKLVLVDEGPEGKLQKSFFPPVQVVKEITPVEIYSPDPGTYMVDMGVNFTGGYKVRLKGNPGDTIVFRFGERIYDDGTLNPMTSVIGQIKRKGSGGPGAPNIAWQTGSYIVGESTDEWYIPEFTYHTYRYMEISGLGMKPDVADIKGLFMHSNVAQQNSFSCSSDLLNSIQEATERTFLANLVSVQSDCAAREKFGYGGDINATSESFVYNFDMQAFYRKTVYDWVDAMNDSSFVDTAPYVGIQYCGISWESAFLITQYHLYLYYHDTAIVRELYEQDKQWMDKVAKIHPNGLVDEGLSDHESLEPVPVELTGTCHYLQCARIMTTFAAEMGDAANEEKYSELANKLKTMVREQFWEQPVSEEINRQTLFATLLFHEIIPADEIPAARDSLMKAVENGPSGHFNTGIFGTKYILESLSEHTPDEVYAIVNSTSYPGWGHMIDRGATTIWETWKESDNTYSNCHPMFGTVTEWYYRWLAGIRPIPEYPGFKQFTLAPSTPEGLDFVNCNYQSPFGKVVSNWKCEGDSYRYEMEIPTGSVANVSLTMMESDKISVERIGDQAASNKIKGLETGKFRLSEGKYVIRRYKGQG